MSTGDDETFWREMARMPDLQKLVERCGRRLAARRGEDFDPIKHPGYPEITHDEWARWNAVNAEFQVNRQAVNRSSSR
jgi:hypothetical protein